MDQDQVGIFSLEPPHGGGTTMGGAIIHNPEDPVRLPIGLLFHDLLDQPTKRIDVGSGFATAKHLGVDSSVLRAYPPSHAALPRPRGRQVAAPLGATLRGTSRVAAELLLPTCRHQCPGRPTRCSFRSLGAP